MNDGTNVLFLLPVWTKYLGFIFDSPFYVRYSELDLALIMATSPPEGSIVHIPIIRLRHLMKMGWKFARPLGSANPVINQRQGGWGQGGVTEEEKRKMSLILPFCGCGLFFFSCTCRISWTVRRATTLCPTSPLLTVSLVLCFSSILFKLLQWSFLYPSHKKSSDKEATWPL